jgi:ubiquinone/menaquinone biosynthesis C-methylase UbiE
MVNTFINKYLVKKIMSAYVDGEKVIVNKINDYPKDNLKILDIGCGNGAIARRIVGNIRKKYVIYGVDLVEKKKVYGEIKYTKTFLDNKNLPYRDNTFDIVYSHQVLEHIIHKDKLIRECKRVLKKGGYCILATENISSFDNILSLVLGQEPTAQHTSTDFHTNSILSPHFMEKLDRNKDGYHLGHKNVNSYYGLKRMMQINGFKNTKIYSYGHLNKLFEKIMPIHNRIIVGFAIK